MPIFDKGAKAIPRKNNRVNKWCWEPLDTHKAEEKKKTFNQNLTPYTKDNSKWIMNLNVKL